MGGEKPVRLLAGRPLIEHVIERAASWSSVVAVSVRDARQARMIGYAPWFLDEGGHGPIAGCATALNFAAARELAGVLTVPCDTPLLPADLLARLEAALTPQADVAVAVSGGRLHPTCALWKSRCATLAASYIAAGKSSVMGLTEAAERVEVEWAISSGDPFLNVNTREQLAALEAVLSRPRLNGCL